MYNCLKEGKAENETLYPFAGKVSIKHVHVDKQWNPLNNQNLLRYIKQQQKRSISILDIKTYFLLLLVADDYVYSQYAYYITLCTTITSMLCHHNVIRLFQHFAG